MTTVLCAETTRVASTLYRHAAVNTTERIPATVDHQRINHILLLYIARVGNEYVLSFQSSTVREECPAFTGCGCSPVGTPQRRCLRESIYVLAADGERMSTDESDNEAYFDWPAPDGPAREVWYSLVSQPDAPVAFWHRYTLVQTADGDSEARVWAALSDARPDGEDLFVSHRYDPSAVELSGGPFSLALDRSSLADDAATGAIDADREVAWSLAYEHDDLTFSPLADESRMVEFADQFGTGVHWSANQSVAMTGEVTVDGTTTRFENAPGHQGHTAGATAQESWTWTHCNDFETDGVALEVLATGNGIVPACLRLPGETHLINGERQVFSAVETTANEPGLWAFDAETDDIEFSARVEADPDHWQLVSYLTPDGSLRYNAHCSLADAELAVGDCRYQSSTARIEWVESDPPVPGSYPPFDP